MELEILYQDQDLVAVNKPHGLLVHRSKIAKDADEFALQMLRDQLQQHVSPCHRLDRKTSGVLLFSLNDEALKKTSELFRTKKISKSYKAIVRGYTEDSGTIDYDLKTESGKSQEAITHYTTVERFEIPLPHGKHESSRYSLLEVQPETGRMHQIRRHLAHIFHPILGDRPHGCNKQNKLWLENFSMNTMMLHAAELKFDHPSSGELVSISAEVSEEFSRVISILKTHE